MELVNKNKDLELVFIVSYFCNFRCTYCDTVKNTHIAEKAIYDKLALLIRNDKKDRRLSLKFFGGEPLFEFKNIKNLIQTDFGKKSVKYYLTSNGSLINDKKVSFFHKNNLDISLSLDGSWFTHSSERKSLMSAEAFKRITGLSKKAKNKVIINMVVSPKNSNKFYENFLYIYEQGFRNFNFLPAAYCKWGKKNVKDLDKNFCKIISFFQKNKIADVYIKNKDINNSLFFFNQEVVIDFNGDIFLNNAFMLNRFNFLREKMIVGNIRSVNSFDDFFKNLKLNKKAEVTYNRVNRFIKESSHDNKEIDFILTKFVNNLKSYEL